MKRRPTCVCDSHFRSTFSHLCPKPVWNRNRSVFIAKKLVQPKTAAAFSEAPWFCVHARERYEHAIVLTVRVCPYPVDNRKLPQRLGGIALTEAYQAVIKRSHHQVCDRTLPSHSPVPAETVVYIYITVPMSVPSLSR